MKCVITTAALAAALIVSASAASAAEPGPSADTVTANPAGTLSKDGTVTMSGTYRCWAPADGGPVFVSSSVQTGSVQHGIGGTQARCDGLEHTWVNQEKPADGASLTPGPAKVQATLLHLDTHSGLPLPAVIATDQHQGKLLPVQS